MWDLITAHYGRCDLELLALVASASGIADPNVIYTGQVLTLSTLDPPPLRRRRSRRWRLARRRGRCDRRRRHAVGHLGGSLRVRVGGPGVVDRRLQRLEDPSDIPIGTVITLPPLDAAGVPSRRRHIRADAAGGGTGAAGGQSCSPWYRLHRCRARKALPPPLDGRAGPQPPPVTTAPAESTPGCRLVDDGAPAARDGASGDRRPGPRGQLVGAVVGGHRVGVGVVVGSGCGVPPAAPAGLGGAAAWRLMPSGESARLHRALVAAADLPLVRWAGQEISGAVRLGAAAGGAGGGGAV